MTGRNLLLTAVDRLGLHVPTAAKPLRIVGLLSIDHVDIPNSWVADSTRRYSALVGKKRISDHDAYVVG